MLEQEQRHRTQEHGLATVGYDDEGVETQSWDIVRDGVLVGYMQDRQNARLMGVEATGNGRRESYAHAPMPRMTNTYMLGGDATPGDLIAGMKDGLYAVGFNVSTRSEINDLHGRPARPTRPIGRNWSKPGAA